MANAKDNLLNNTLPTSSPTPGAAPGVSARGQAQAGRTGGVLGPSSGGAIPSAAGRGAGSANAAEARMRPHSDPKSAPKVSAGSLPKVMYTGDKKETYVDSDAALAQFYKWSDKERKQWGDYAVQVGLIVPEDNTYDGQLAVWKRVVQEGTQFSAVGKQYTPKQIAGLLGAQGVSLSAPGSTKTPPFTGTKTQTDQTFSITDPSSAKYNISALFQHYLGRDPAPGELSTFADTLKKAEQDNPIKTVTDARYVNDEPVGSTVTKTGGVNGTQVLTDSARALPEYGAYQAATTYANKLFQAIASPV